MHNERLKDFGSISWEIILLKYNPSDVRHIYYKRRNLHVRLRCYRPSKVAYRTIQRHCHARQLCVLKDFV